jgi:UDP-N-acetylmuramoylalanine--D-glutamate ligase
VHLILGGQAKGQDLTSLRGPVAARAAAVYLIGEDAEQIAAALHGTVALHRCGHLERAVAAARMAAEPGEVVLLSPACPSFDQYASYEQRGDHFRALARAL